MECFFGISNFLEEVSSLSHSVVFLYFIVAMKLKDALIWKDMTNLDSILRSRDITLPTKVHLVKAMIFLVVRDGCESWTIKKA